VDIRVCHKFLLLVIKSAFSCVCDVICLTYPKHGEWILWTKKKHVEEMTWTFPHKSCLLVFALAWVLPHIGSTWEFEYILISWCMVRKTSSDMRVCLCHGPQSSFPACPLASIMIWSILKTDYFMQNCFRNVVIFLMRN